MSKVSKKEKEIEVVESSEAEQNEESSGITVGDPQVLRPTELPLVVKLPKDASKAQQRFAEVLNAYAYQSPTKWHAKKNVLIKELEALKNAPDPVEDSAGKLIVGTKNKLSV